MKQVKAKQKDSRKSMEKRWLCRHLSFSAGLLVSMVTQQGGSSQTEAN